MGIKNILVVFLLVSLYGCEPEASAPHSPVVSAVSVPVAMEPSAASTSTVQAAQPATKQPVSAVAAPLLIAADAMQLAKKNNCLACHAIDKKVIGPAWKAVAARYRGDAQAEARLMDKIAEGGSGVWGVMVMTPSPQIGESDRRTLARFVLSLQ